MHEEWILRTFELAELGLSGVSPNPLVGCVIVKDGRVVGEGYHAIYGTPHAEIHALRSAGEEAQGAVLYCNLEPCCHWGKTPPCTQAIIKAGIKQVVAAIPDPNPLVQGKGFQQLKQAGISVKHGICVPEARELNRAFIKFVTQKKPYVILKAALSLDGKIASRSGDSKWITSVESRNFSYRLRSQADAILVGAETVRTDNPHLTSHGRGRNPMRIVLSKSKRLPKDANIFKDGLRTWVFSPSKKGKYGIQELLKLCASQGISKLLVEGGGETAAAFLEAGEVDELFYFIAPILIGGRDAKTAFEGEGVRGLSDALKVKVMDIRHCGEDLLIHGRIIKSC